ncbi:MAG: hypothetical protein FJZ00_03545 [Candidatus Sericytochromatia bacterium]|uniref:SCP domain-containing protein n=1 Tax=Candidatus Tanganyikabacteria bacterium TaxID=2961651 RepID=A0A937X5X8_9BACT|nr:hypothetical protein [Candidatus Tanganyikabacteria bacterium]
MQAIGQVLGQLAPVVGNLLGGQQAKPGNAAQAPGLGFGLDGAAITPQGNAATIALGNHAPPFGQNPGFGGQPIAGNGGIAQLVEAIMQIIAGFMRLFGFGGGGAPVADPGGNPGFGDPGFGNPGFGDPGFGDPGFGDPGFEPFQAGNAGAATRPQAPGQAQSTGSATEYERGLLEAANQVRRGMGLRELRWADDLSQTARRSAAAGTHLGAPEILSFGDGTPAQAIDIWRGSPPHWSLLTDPNFSEMGAGRQGGNSAITFR